MDIPEPKEADILPENIPLDIVYEDNDLLVVNKTKGMVVHPAHSHYSGTLVNALMYHCGDSLSGINEQAASRAIVKSWQNKYNGVGSSQHNDEKEGDRIVKGGSFSNDL